MDPGYKRKGRYGVYVSYKTLKTVVMKLYIVYIIQVGKDLKVNQQMGGGTWIFLGYFDFDEGRNNKITLTNKGKSWKNYYR